MHRKLLFSLLISVSMLNAVEYSDSSYDYRLFSEDNGRKCAVITYCSSDEKDITVPESILNNGDTYTVTGIDEYSFSYTVPTSITLPSGIETIGDSAFYQCESLKRINFPESITSVCEWAFGECSSLKSIVVNSAVDVGEWAFCDCKNLSCADLSGVKSIGADCFNGCENMTSVFLSGNIESIGDDAFYSCYNLTDVYFEGSKSQWESIITDTDNEYLKKATVHFISSKEEKNLFILSEYLVNNYYIDSRQYEELDVNGDNEINSFDLVLMRKNIIS